MPELPEVETILRGLHKHLIGEVINHVLCSPARIFQSTEFHAEELLPGKTIRQISRRGKYLIFRISDIYMVVHLGMTGQLLLSRVASSESDLETAPDPHIHFHIHLTSGQLLLYRDPRKFGKILFFTSKKNLLSYFSRLGTEPLSEEFTCELFSKILAGRKGKIKPFLLNQSQVCGIGNIYADEALFLSRIHPETTISSLSPENIRDLHKAIPSVLEKGIESGGTTFRDYRNSEGREGGFQEQLNVYGREGLPCLICQNLIQRIQVGGRSSHFCPACQRSSAVSS